MEQVVEKSNFEMFKNLVETLAGSQGFYSRLQRQLNEMSEEELMEVEEQINNCGQKFKEPVDVILWLEQ